MTTLLYALAVLAEFCLLTGISVPRLWIDGGIQDNPVARLGRKVVWPPFLCGSEATKIIRGSHHAAFYPISYSRRQKVS